MAKERPGFYIFHNFRPTFDQLTMEQRGQIVTALFDFSQYGFLPDFSDDPALRLLWPAEMEKLNRQADQYMNQCARNAYNQYRRWQKEKGKDVLPFDEWRTSVYEPKRANTSVYECIPKELESESELESKLESESELESELESESELEKAKKGFDWDSYEKKRNRWKL